jgi:hypothetical protein
MSRVRVIHLSLQTGKRRSRLDTAKVVAGIALLVLFPTDAFAYIDPGTGSLAYQIALALLLGLGVVLRHAWRKPLELIKRLRTPGPGTPPDSTDLPG